MMPTLFSIAFMMGFLGSPHCLGMCGGIVTAFGLSMKGGNQTLLTLVYHAGRLTSYALLGMLAGLIGLTVLAPFMTANGARMLLAVSLVLVGGIMLGLPILNQLEKMGLKLWQNLAPMRQRLFPLNTIPRAFAAGLLWGLLPCGLVYGALVVAVSMGAGHQYVHVTHSALFMMIFGLGTMPMLLATQSVVALVNERIKRFSVRKISGVFLLVFGFGVLAMPFLHQHGHHGHHGHQEHSQVHGQQEHSHGNHGANMSHDGHDMHTHH